MGWWVLGPRKRCSSSEGPPLPGPFQEHEYLGMEWNSWPWRNPSPGFDSQGVSDTWETQRSHWELSPGLHRVQNQFTFLQWCKGFSNSGALSHILGVWAILGYISMFPIPPNICTPNCIRVVKYFSESKNCNWNLSQNTIPILKTFFVVLGFLKFFNSSIFEIMILVFHCLNTLDWIQITKSESSAEL